MSLVQHSRFIPFNAAKWLSLQVLVDVPEMKDLLNVLENIHIYPVGAVLPADFVELNKEEFLASYATYIETLKSGNIPTDASYRPLFSCAFSLTSDALYSQTLVNNKQIIRPIKPVVQLQAHHLNYSLADEKFHQMVFAQDSIIWGVQLSYPQFCEDTTTYEPYRVDNRFTNTNLFKAIQQWVRNNTIPTPFMINGKRINVPMRIGKKCLSWINNHQQLIQKGIKVVV